MTDEIEVLLELIEDVLDKPKKFTEVNINMAMIVLIVWILKDLTKVTIKVI